MRHAGFKRVHCKPLSDQKCFKKIVVLVVFFYGTFVNGTCQQVKREWVKSVYNPLKVVKIVRFKPEIRVFFTISRMLKIDEEMTTAGNVVAAGIY